MRIIVITAVLAFFLSGCTTQASQEDQILSLRQEIIAAETCSFEASITADYTDVLYAFQMECEYDSAGSLHFCVTEPESICGITGSVSQQAAGFTFEESVLAFPLMADGQVSPISAPWLFMNTLQNGYLTGCSKTEDGLCAFFNDSYEENPLHLQIHLNSDGNPIYAEIVWQERRVLSLAIQNFSIQ